MTRCMLSLLSNLFGRRSRGFNPFARRQSGFQRMSNHKGGITAGALGSIAAVAVPFLVQRMRARHAQRANVGAL
jgi:hypothetical protein